VKPKHSITAEFYEYDETAPYKATQLQPDHTDIVTDGEPFNRCGTLPVSFIKSGVRYVYYGVSIDGGLPDTRPLTGAGALPSVLFASVNGNHTVTYLYKAQPAAELDSPKKNAYINGSPVAENGEENDPVIVEVGDEIKYEIIFAPALPPTAPIPVFQPKAVKPVPVKFINGDFSEPVINVTPPTPVKTYNNGYSSFYNQTDVPGWSTRPTHPEDVTNQYAFTIEYQKPTAANVTFAWYAPVGDQYAELNAEIEGTLYQVCDTVPGTKVYYEFYHGARGAHDGLNTDVMNFYLRAEDDTADGLQRICSDSYTRVGGKVGPDYQWGYYTGSYIVPEGQTRTEFSFESFSTTSGSHSLGNYLAGIRLYTPSYIELAKSNNTADNKAKIGDVVTYTIIAQNTGESDASKVVISDILPAGTTLVPSTVKIDGVNTANYSYSSFTNEISVNIGASANTTTGGLFKGDGSRSNDCGDIYTLTFDIEVTGDEIAENFLYENQAKVTYKDRYDADHDVYTNYSNIDVLACSTGTMTVTDTIQKGLEILSIDDGCVEGAGQKITWTFEDLPVLPKTITVTVKVTEQGLFKNNATVTYYDGSEKDTNDTWHETREDRILHLRQVVLGYDGSTILPYIGYFILENNSRTFSLTADSNKDGLEVVFRDIKVTFTDPDDMIYFINDIVPQYYTYDGYIATTSYTAGSHHPALKDGGDAQADFNDSDEIWVTVYIRAKSDPGKHDWDFKTNDFGIIYPVN